MRLETCHRPVGRSHHGDVEPRKARLAPGRTHLSPEGAADLCDENTIGVVTILGSTFDGSYDPVAEIAAALDRLESERGLDVPIHVDAARESGGSIPRNESCR